MEKTEITEITKPAYITRYVRIVRVKLHTDKQERYPTIRYGILYPATGNIGMGDNGEGYASMAMAINAAAESGYATIWDVVDQS